VLTGAKVNHSVSVIGFGGTVLKYDPVSPIALNELTGSAATLTTRNVAIAAQRGDKFLVRTTINNDPHRDGRDFRGFMLEFAGKPPKDLFGKLTNGTFVPLSRPIVAMQPWGTAEKVMREMFRPFTSAQQP
jgi:hypothetical protein